MIKLCRVDHRLLHGQVAFSWSHALGADAILIVSDEVASNEVRMKTMRLAKPVGIKLVIKGVDDSIKAIKSGVTDKYRLLIVTGSIADAERLVRECGISSLNLGGTVKVVRGLARDGVEVEVRQVAKDKKVVLSEKDL